jgi:transposase
VALRVRTMAEIRLEVLLEPERTGASVAEVCRRHGISRDTYYRYRRRYVEEGLEGLEDRTRTPRRCPAQIDSELEIDICRMRKDHPRWGARRIRAELERGGIDPPAVSTIHQALRRNHLVALQPPRPGGSEAVRAGGVQRPLADRRHPGEAALPGQGLGPGHHRRPFPAASGRPGRPGSDRGGSVGLLRGGRLPVRPSPPGPLGQRAVLHRTPPRGGGRVRALPGRAGGRAHHRRSVPPPDPGQAGAAPPDPQGSRTRVPPRTSPTSRNCSMPSATATTPSGLIRGSGT